jgi:hypothetical protein
MANGTSASWATLTPMPIARANHCSAVLGGTLLVIGGNTKPAGSTDFVTTDVVHAADLQSDGTLGPWRIAGHTPSPVIGCTAAVNGNELLVIGGLFDQESDGGAVWSATLGPDGMLDAFQRRGGLPAGRVALSSAAWMDADTLFVVDTDLPTMTSAGRVVVMHATLPAGGAVGAWTVDSGPSPFRGRAQYAFAHGALYTLGGYTGGKVNATVTDASVTPIVDGAVGASVSVIALLHPRSFGKAVAVDDYIFVVGGKDAIFSGAGETEVDAAAIGADGQLGGWSAVAPLPDGRSNNDAVLGGDFLYVTGGGMGGPGLADVFAARVRFLPDAPH